MIGYLRCSSAGGGHRRTDVVLGGPSHRLLRGPAGLCDLLLVVEPV